MFHFPGARLRAEVYVNGRLVGYTIISEAPFAADATDAIIPGGTNLLAVRLTNPGGNLDWIDFQTMPWGKYTLPVTHAFGGLSGGLEMQVRAPVSVGDLAVFNKPDPRSVHLQAEISSAGQAYNGPVNFSIAREGKVVFQGSKDVSVPAGETVTTSVNLPSGTTSHVADAASMTCRLAARGWRQIHLLAGKTPRLPQILAILLCHPPSESQPPTGSTVPLKNLSRS